MSTKTLTAKVVQRHDTAANWSLANPVLLAGEIGVESDTQYAKLGNGTTTWNSLTYMKSPYLDASAYATKEEAEAGTVTNKVMSPAVTKAAILKISPTILTMTINAASWSSSTYTISNANITANSIITLAPSSTMTSAQYDAVSTAKIVESSITTGQVVLKALGTVPTIDCPVVLIIEVIA